jgi:hypothetical protein
MLEKSPCRSGHAWNRNRFGQCIDCKNAQWRRYRARDPERHRVRVRQWREDNPDHERLWREANVEKERERSRLKHAGKTPEQRKKDAEQTARYKKANRAKATADQMKRQADKMLRTPKWIDLKAVEAFYVEARRLTVETGVLHVVDHILPLRGKEVSGLHVQHNLRVITAQENNRKYNKVIEQVMGVFNG